MTKKTFLSSLKSKVKSSVGSTPEEAKDQKLAEKNRRLKKYRELVEKKDSELAALKDELSRIRDSTNRPALSREETPVFFVVGRAKSGTSWLMRILDSHPEILCKGEGRFFGRNFIREDLEQARKSKIQPSSLYRSILEADYLRAWIEKSVWTRGENVDEHLTNLTRVAANYFLTQRLANTSKRIVGDKTPFLTAGMTGEIGEIYPEARVIHIIRDGRDTAVSNSHHRWNHARDEGGIYDLTPEELERRESYRKNPRKFIESGKGFFTEKMIRGMAAGWRNQISKSRKDGQSLLGDNYTEVKYEDLLVSPKPEVERILRFLGAESSDETVNRCIGSASFEKWTKGRERGQEDSASFLRKGVAGDWQNVFTEKDKRIFKEEAGDLLIELGYEEDGSW